MTLFPIRRVRALRTHAVVALALCLDLILWLLVSVWEENAAIGTMHAALLVLSLPCVFLLDKYSSRIFVAALLPRSCLTAIAWYGAYNDERKFFIGTMDDPAKYWSAALLPLDEAIRSFEDPFFAILNVYITDISKAIAAPAYLATMQPVLFAGVLMAVFSYLLVKDLYGPVIAKWTGYLMAFSPSAIVFATGLLRDVLIGMFGFLMLLCLNRAITKRGIAAKTLATVIFVGCVTALAFLRSISLAGFLLASLLMLFSNTPYRENRIPRKLKLIVTITAAIILGIAIIDRPDRFDAEKILSYAVASRAGDEQINPATLDPNGITTKIADISPALFIAIAPYALIQPMPFYSWSPSDYIGGPPALMDIFLGLGGLFNQLLFGFYILAAQYWITSRDTFGFRVCLLFTLLIATLTIVGLGSTRMVMAHCFPFYFLGVGVAISTILHDHRIIIKRVFLTWGLSLLALYCSYWLYRELGNAMLALGTFAIALVFAYKTARFGARPLVPETEYSPRC